MKAESQGFRAFVGQRAHIYIFLETAPFYQLHRYPAQLISGIGQVNLEQAAAVEQALIVLLKPKEVKLLLFAVPVASDALKQGGAVVKTVSHNPYLGFRQRHELLIEIGV